MNEQDLPKDSQPQHEDSEPTQRGMLAPPQAAVTRQLATPPPPPRQPNAATRERIATLVAALGDPEHPLHQQAAGDLVAIGDPAVPALNEALNPRRPWLTSFRATEVLGQIGDGRATSALLEALRHPNSNVRWGAVRALAVIGDARAMLDLRRVANDDRAKTSWGESVADAAESALDQMRSQNVLFRSAELIKTALACVIMLVAVVVAWSVITSLRNDLERIGHDQIDSAALFAPITPTPDPDATATAEAEATPTPAPDATAETGAALPATTPEASTVITGTALNVANVRSEPNSQRENKVGSLNPGDEIIFLAQSTDNRWYKIQLGEQHRASSRIDSPDGTGWVIDSLLSEPDGELPVEEAPSPTAVNPEPTAPQT